VHLSEVPPQSLDGRQLQVHKTNYDALAWIIRKQISTWLCTRGLRLQDSSGNSIISQGLARVISTWHSARRLLVAPWTNKKKFEKLLSKSAQIRKTKLLCLTYMACRTNNLSLFSGCSPPLIMYNQYTLWGYKLTQKLVIQFNFMHRLSSSIVKVLHFVVLFF
jgi:hypothetical protein